MLFGRIFAKFEDLGAVHVGDQVFRFLAELVSLLRLSQILNGRIFVLVVLELLDQPLDFVLAYCILRIECRKKVLQLFGDPRGGYKFSRNCSNRLMVPKMILRLGFVDLADHAASSIFKKTRGTLGVKRTFW